MHGTSMTCTVDAMFVFVQIASSLLVLRLCIIIENQNIPSVTTLLTVLFIH